MKSKQQTIDNLLTPSWLSGLIAVATGLVVTVGVILAFSFNTSQVQQQLADWQNTSAPALTLPGQNPPGSNTNSLQNTWPLIAVWAAIGLVVYFIVESATRGLRGAEEFREELGYVHARRDILLKKGATGLLIRLLATVLWLIFIEIFFKRIIPYSIMAARASTEDLISFYAVLYALLSFSMIALSLHVHAIFLRLVLRRPRVFSNG